MAGEAGGAPRPAGGPAEAWVTLVMIGVSHVPGALVLADSLRRAGTRAAVVCMVTPDIPPEAVGALQAVFDRVVEVGYIEHPSRRFESRRQQDMYGGWIDRSFTKWACLGLTEYARVVFLDADIVAVAPMDDLFDLPAPAGTFSHPWVAPWHAAPEGGGRRGLQNPYASLLEGGDIPHGARVPAALARRALATGGHAVCGGLVRLDPSAAGLAALRAEIAAEPVFGAGLRTTSGADEVSITLHFGDWTAVHQRYQAVPWKPRWVCAGVRAYHFIGRKPWDMSPEEWPDLALWWDAARALAAARPALAAPLGLAPPGGGAAAAEAAAAGRPPPLDVAAAELRVSSDLLAILARALGRGGGREAGAILGRWLLGAANEALQAAPAGAALQAAPAGGGAGAGAAGGGAGAGAGAGAPPAGCWSPLLGGALASPGALGKLAGEVRAARARARPEEGGAPRAAAAARAAAEEAFDVVRARAGRPPGAAGGRPALRGAGAAARLDFAPHCSWPAGGRLGLLAARGGAAAAAAVAARYAAAGGAGLQWGVPTPHARHLVVAFGVRNEAFASPLNARLLGPGPPGAEGGPPPEGPPLAFHSLFPDTDAPFGSLGPFAGAPRAGGWLVNPPFVEQVLEQAARWVLAWLEEGRHPGPVFFVAPRWLDTPAVLLLGASRFLAARRDLEAGAYRFEDPEGAPVRTLAPSVYFALSAGGGADAPRLGPALADWR